MATTLAAGDIAFTAFQADNADGAGGDYFQFALLREVTAGTTLYFTDNGYLTGTDAFRTNENVLRWVAQTDLAAGSLVSFTSPAGNGTPSTAEWAGINPSTGAVLTSAALGLSTSGDQIAALIDPTFGGTDALTGTAIAGLTFGGTAYAANFTVNDGTNSTGLPAGLVDGATAVSVGNFDNGRYDADTAGSVESGTAAAVRASINTDSHWITGEATLTPFATNATFAIDGAAALPALSIADAAIAEGNAGSRDLVFTVSLSAAAPDGGVTFDIAAASDPGDTAAAGSDYTAASRTGLTIPAGQTRVTFAVPVAGDRDVEADETFTVRIGNVSGATVADGEAVGTVRNDDAGDLIGGIALFDAAPSLQGAQGATPATAPTGTDALRLVRLGAYATTDDPATRAAANAEVVAYDASTNRFYVQNTNENRIEIVALSPTGALTKIDEIPLAGLAGYGSVNSVAVNNGLVAVAYANAVGDQPGRVALFDGDGTLLNSVAVGVGPDQVVFDRTGSRLLVSNEGEQFTAGSNPVGSVSIIDVSGGAAGASVTATVGFGALDGSEAALRDRGLAITPGTAASADIEPEYITVSPDNRFAFVTLQEVNGIAVIDLANPGSAPIAVQPLGSVNHALPGNEFDASDRDGPPASPGGNGTASIRIATTPAGTPIYGLLQPDAAASFEIGGATYVITANEGDQRVIGGADDGGDVARLSTVPDERLTPELRALKTDPAYARLNVLLRTGDTDGDGVIDQLTTLGGRGVSIFRQEADGSLTKVRETGGEFEKIFASLAPGRFNNDQTVANSPDDRSDNKGPEPEGITVGTVNGRTYAFIGLERQSGVLVYDVTDPANAAYVSYVPPLAGSTADLGPEVVNFIAADRNATGTNLVATASEAGGGLTLYAALPANAAQQVAFQGPVSIGEGDAGTSDLTFTVTRTGGVLGDVAFSGTIALGTGVDGADFAGGTAPTAFSGTIPAGQSSAEVTLALAGDRTPETNETVTLTLTSAVNARADEGIAAAPAASGASAVGTITNDDGAIITRISAVQGEGAASLVAGQTVTLDAIVVGDFQNGDADAKRSIGGFYLQEETADADGNPLTSEGVFVYEGGGALRADVAEGDRVRVTGVVTEFNGETQVTIGNAADIQVVQAGALDRAGIQALAAEVTLPAAGTIGTGTTAQPDLERYEGMLVRLPQTLSITEQFNLDRFNEIRLAAGGRPETFTNEFEPNAQAYQAYLAQTAARSITYDDGLNTQNQPVELLDGFAGYGTATAPRMGDTVTDLTGVLGYGPASAYRVRSIEDGSNTFVDANPRPAAPDDVGGSLRVGSLNVLNYFRTLDSDGSATGVKTAIGLDPRGANTGAEFDRQTEKLVTTLIGTGADVLGLTELENQFQPGNPGNALEYLVGQLNARAGAGTYAYVNPGDQLDQGQFLGSDAIAVGFIYKPSRVSVAMDTTIQKLDDADVRQFDPGLLEQSTIGAIFNGANTSRAALAVTFEERATGEDFTAVINHLKSKSGTGTGADADQGDGQGAWQQQRELAARALSEWVALKPTGTTDSDAILLGDFNAYIKEDALDVLKASGYTNLAEDRLANPYSYVFDGAYGALDHALANPSLNGQVTGVTEWHVNADEADALDYNLDFNRDPRYFDGQVAARESDHDPVLVGLALRTPPAGGGGGGTPTPVGPTFGSDNLTGTNGADRTLLLGGDDSYLGMAGNDTVYGNQGDDTLYGNLGADTLYGGQGRDILFGGQDDDLLLGDRDDDIVLGNRGNDVVLGNMGNDSVYGGQGNDTLYGGQGNDLLSGDLGDDVLSGDLGADTYRFSANSGRDRVLGFSQASGDRLDLQGQTFTFGAPVNGNAVLVLSGGGTVELAGVTQDQVNDGFFTT